VPLVDAGMRELWTTGYMHNRVRMVAASFLVKNLLVDWRVGEQWFWDTLVDADEANNPGNWQWVAGSGADAAPYFRVFNPELQAKKFDGDGHYVRQWAPEHLSDDPPAPIVDLAQSRRDALAAFEQVRAAAR
jgi:deoxyribodipyrimidine photo-lyase